MIFFFCYRKWCYGFLRERQNTCPVKLSLTAAQKKLMCTCTKQQGQQWFRQLVCIWGTRLEKHRDESDKQNHPGDTEEDGQPSRCMMGKRRFPGHGHFSLVYDQMEDGLRGGYAKDGSQKL